MGAHDVAIGGREMGWTSGNRGWVWRVESVRLGSSSRGRRNGLAVSALGWTPTTLDKQEGLGSFAMGDSFTVQSEIEANNLNLTPLEV